MATARVQTAAEITSSLGVIPLGSRGTWYTFTISGGEFIDKIATILTGATEELWDSAASVVPVIEFLIAHSDTADVYLEITGTAAADKSYVALEPQVLAMLAGFTLSYAAAVKQNITRVRVVNKNAASANVRVILG